MLAPIVAAVSRVRRARTFHPRGLVFVGRCEPIAGDAGLAALGEMLSGRVLARCSGALWKQPHERFDVLGIALRLRRAPRAFSAVALPGDRDLLFATIRSPLTMLAAPFVTDAHDFLANTFFAVAPFAVCGRERVELRLVPLARGGTGGSRAERLRAAVAAGRGAWRLDARRTLTRRWHPVAHVVLEREAGVDQEALRFDAFRTGAGLEPVGFVHAIRRAVYAASQAARPVAAIAPPASAGDRVAPL